MCKAAAKNTVIERKKGHLKLDAILLLKDLFSLDSSRDGEDFTEVGRTFTEFNIHKF